MSSVDILDDGGFSVIVVAVVVAAVEIFSLMYGSVTVEGVGGVKKFVSTTGSSGSSQIFSVCPSLPFSTAVEKDGERPHFRLTSGEQRVPFTSCFPVDRCVELAGGQSGGRSDVKLSSFRGGCFTIFVTFQPG